MSMADFKGNVCHFGAGMLGGMAGLVIGYPADTIKVRQQTNSKYGHLALHCTRETLGHEGLRGFFKGMAYPLFAVGVINSTFFGVYGSTIRLQQTLRSKDVENWGQTGAQPPPPPSYGDMFAAGTFGGAMQAIPATPIELVKVKLQVQRESPEKSPKLYKGPTDCMRCIIRESGVRGPFKGFALTVARDASSFGIYMLSFQYICDCLTPNYEVNEPTAGVVLFAGGMAGCISWYNMPVDIVKSRIQADSVSNPRYTGWRSCSEALYREGGWKAFYRGFPVTVIRTFPLNAVTFFVYQKSLAVLQRLLHVDTLE